MRSFSRSTALALGVVSLCALASVAPGDERAGWEKASRARGSSAALVFPTARVREREETLGIDGLVAWEDWRNDERVSVRVWDPRPAWWAWPDWPRPEERWRIPPIDSHWGRSY